MKWSTEVHLPKTTWEISHANKIVSIGSCFADCLGQRFQKLHFDVVANPFGTIYNPISIFTTLSDCLHDHPIDTSQLVEARQRFFHYQFHSEINATSKDGLIERAKRIISDVSTQLKGADYCIFTLGTAFVYYLRGSNISVANCHKMPNTHFEKKMVEPEDIIKSFEYFFRSLLAVQPSVRVILTVSPVRHVKDTLVMNSVSKSVLRWACHKIVESFSQQVSYFPSYEIMMDELRDYRFYEQDMLHPTAQAQSYIWEQFSKTYFSDETKELEKQITDIIAALGHRPFFPESSEYQIFIKNQLEKAEKINDKLPVPGFKEKMAQLLNN